jgi:hypothetical protein
MKSTKKSDIFKFLGLLLLILFIVGLFMSKKADSYIEVERPSTGEIYFKE